LVHSRRLSAWAAFALSTLAPAASWTPLFQHALAAEAPGNIIVNLDQAKLVSLPKGPHRIILGNPLIVGVTQLQSGGLAILTGKAFGETNMIVIDERGAVELETTIRVALPSGTDLVVQRGQQHASYGCASGCELRMQLGDVGEAAQDSGAQIRARNGLATSDAAGTNPSSKSGGAL
jgi:hypothetical protein